MLTIFVFSPERPHVIIQIRSVFSKGRIISDASTMKGNFSPARFAINVGRSNEKCIFVLCYLLEIWNAIGFLHLIRGKISIDWIISLGYSLGALSARWGCLANVKDNLRCHHNSFLSARANIWSSEECFTPSFTLLCWSSFLGSQVLSVWNSP